MLAGTGFRIRKNGVAAHGPAVIVRIQSIGTRKVHKTRGAIRGSLKLEKGDLLRSERIRAESVITHRFALRDAAQAFRLVANPGDALKAVIVAN